MQHPTHNAPKAPLAQSGAFTIHRQPKPNPWEEIKAILRKNNGLSSIEVCGSRAEMLPNGKIKMMDATLGIINLTEDFELIALRQYLGEDYEQAHQQLQKLDLAQTENFILAIAGLKTLPVFSFQRAEVLEGAALWGFADMPTNAWGRINSVIHQAVLALIQQHFAGNCPVISFFASYERYVRDSANSNNQPFDYAPTT